MRILLDQAAHDMRNKGNNALVQAAAEGLLELWPDASIDLVTIAPHLARMYFPNLHPVSPGSLRQLRGRSERLQGLLPAAVFSLILELREEVWHRWPAFMPSQIRRAIRSRLSTVTSGPPYAGSRTATSGDGPAADHGQAAFREAMSQYDLLVESGGGALTDSDASLLEAVFGHLQAAIKLGIPTVMVGQGVGPIEDPVLRAQAMQVLPRVDLIFVRERRVALPLLHSLGVHRERIRMTGDDALEMAYLARAAALGQGIGVSLRVAHYTQVQASHIGLIRSVLLQAADKRGAPLVAVPISSAPHESDVTHIKKLLKGHNNRIIGWRKLDGPSDAIKTAGHCRIMVTGTYHGAIFALAQGIPVVSLTKSVEYYNKMSGLTDEFGPGCQVVRLDEPQLADRLSTAIDRAWSSAEEFRPALLAAAVEQIKLRRAAYQCIRELVADKNAAGPVGVVSGDRSQAGD